MEFVIVDILAIRQVFSISILMYSTLNWKIVTSQPWKHFQRVMSWMIGQAAWAWAKTGIWESDYAEAYAYANDEEVHVVHDDYHESEEKTAADSKDEKPFNDQDVLINRTHLEVCDQEVNINFASLHVTTLFILLRIFSLSLSSPFSLLLSLFFLLAACIGLCSGLIHYIIIPFGFQINQSTSLNASMQSVR